MSISLIIALAGLIGALVSVIVNEVNRRRTIRRYSVSIEAYDMVDKLRESNYQEWMHERQRAKYFIRELEEARFELHKHEDYIRSYPEEESPIFTHMVQYEYGWNDQWGIPGQETVD